MGAAVAVAASRKLGENSGRMRLTVTILALGYHLVLGLMAGGAQKGAVLGRTRLKLVVDIAMTGSTALGRNILRIGDIKRHMNLMTGYTISKGHVVAVRTVAFHTAWYAAMLIAMTGGAGKGRVLARMFLELCNLVSMTGEARRGQVPFQGNI